MKLHFGQYVHHIKYGWGTVLELNLIQTTVYFRDVGIRKLVTSRTAFDLIGGEAHKKRVPLLLEEEVPGTIESAKRSATGGKK